MAMTTAEIIKGVMNNDKCNLSIWDPCPAAVSWGQSVDKDEAVEAKSVDGADVADAEASQTRCKTQSSLISKCRNTIVRTEIGSRNSLFPNFYDKFEDDENQKCTEWEAYNKYQLTKYMPQNSVKGTPFRFCIILAGPPGSGKSTMAEIILKKSITINRNAAIDNIWVNLGHDQIVCQDADFILKMNAIDRTFMEEDENLFENVERIKEQLNVSGTPWNKLIARQNELYDTIKTSNQMDPVAKEYFRENEITPENINALKMLISEEGLYKSNLGPLIVKDMRKGALGGAKITKCQVDYPYLKSVINKWRDKRGEAPCNNAQLLYYTTALAISLGYNITYETTLKSKKSLEFLFKNTGNLTNNCRSETYIFLLGFPLVSFAHLEKRIINRYKCVQIKRLIEKHSKLPQDTVINEQLPDGKYPTRRQFLILLEETFKAHCPTSKANENETCTYVGLPNLQRSHFVNNMNKAYLTIATLLWFCTGPERPADEGGRSNCPQGIGIDFLYIFDNTVSGVIPKKEYGFPIRISDRSKFIQPAKFLDTPRLQEKTKKFWIAVLMKTLNCLKGKSICSAVSDISTKGMCSSPPASQEVDFDDEGCLDDLTQIWENHIQKDLSPEDEETTDEYAASILRGLREHNIGEGLDETGNKLSSEAAKEALKAAVRPVSSLPDLRGGTRKRKRKRKKRQTRRKKYH